MTPPSAVLRATGTHTGEVLVDGSFDHPHWLAHLGAGLAEAGVSITEGSARRGNAGMWRGGFALDTRSLRGTLESLDPVGLAGRRPARSTLPLALDEVAVSRRTDGPLEVTLLARDERGFLGRLLGRVAVLTLLPLEVELATTAGWARDRFVLAGIGGAAPNAEVEDALRTMLTALTATTRREPATR